MRKWEDLPEFMKCDEVKEYYNIISSSQFFQQGFPSLLCRSSSRRSIS